MNILILNPPHPDAIIREGRCQSPQNMRKNSIPQMTLAYLAGTLTRANYDIKVRDCVGLDMNSQDLFTDINGFIPDLAIVNTTTPSINADLSFSSLLKKRYPNCFIALFGTHVTILHQEILRNFNDIDCIIRNEPEWAAIELASALATGKIPTEGIPGCTLNINGSPISAERPYNTDLDSLGFPLWEVLPLDSYIHPVFNKPYVMVNTSRGCSHKCIFCVASIFYGKIVRSRSIPNIIDEIENYIIGKLGIYHIWFYADDFTSSPDYVKELCSAIIDRNLKITWWSNTRVDKHDEEMFRLMKKAGCFMLSIGGESGNREILKKIKKGTKPEQIKTTVKLLRKNKINSLVYFLIGLPGETLETIRNTIDFAKEIGPDYIEFYPATPYPGTEYYEYAYQMGLIRNYNWDKYMCGGNEFVIEIEGVSKNELDTILKKAYKEFYFRPAYFLVLFKRILSPVEFFRLLRFGGSYFSRFFSNTSKL